MTSIEDRLSSCTFSDALYVTADDGSGFEIAEEDNLNRLKLKYDNRESTPASSDFVFDTSSEYFTAQSQQHTTNTFNSFTSSSSADDSGLSCGTPPYRVDSEVGYPLSSSRVDIDLLEKTLEEEAGDTDMLVSDEEENIISSQLNRSNCITNDKEIEYIQNNENQVNANKELGKSCKINSSSTTANNTNNSTTANNSLSTTRHREDSYNTDTTVITHGDSTSTLSGGGGSQNPFIIVAASHQRHQSSSSFTSLYSLDDDTASGSEEEYGKRESVCSNIDKTNDNDEDRSSRDGIGDNESISSSIHLSTTSSFFFEQPSMEYEDAYFAPCAESSPSSKQQHQERDKIYIRELSFDELQDVKGVDLMAPVFLAVTNEADDSGFGLQRKCKSIEDLCSNAISQHPIDFFDDSLRRRSKSALNISGISFSTNIAGGEVFSGSTNNKRKRTTSPKKPSPLLMDGNPQFSESHFANDEQGTTTNSNDFEDITTEQISITNSTSGSVNTSLKSHLSYEDVRLPSITSCCSPHGSDAYHTSMEFDIPNSDDYLPSPNEDNFSCSESGDMNQAEFRQSENADFTFNTNISTLTRTPERVQGSTCGFWEYPYGGPTSPTTPLPQLSVVLRQTSKNATNPNEDGEEGGGVQSPGINTSPISQGSPSLTSSSPSSSSSPSPGRFVVVNVAGLQRIVDMKLIEGYLQILTHGGHHVVGKERRVIVVFNAYYLPRRNTPKYNIVMEQLFYYCVHAVNLMVPEAYEIVFFNSAMDGANMPSRQLIKQCYEMIQYRLRKNLQNIYFVHPSLLLKTVLRFTKFFTSSKFRRKIHFVKNLKVLKGYLPIEYIFVSSEIKQLEQKKFS